jgi:RND family efflux transporter MFP subunit
MRRMFCAGLFVIVSAGLLIVSCGRGPATDENVTRIVPVSVTELTLSDMREVFSFTGSIEPWKQLDVVPDVGGKIARIYVEVGDAVQNGQVLAELDPETFELQLKQAKAAVAVAQANFDDAKRNWERMQELKAKGSASDQQYEKIHLAYDAAEAQLQQARAGLDLAEWQLRTSVMKAPFAGVITGKYLNEGDMINPQMPGGRGVIGLMDMSRVKIKINASEHEIPKISKGQEVKVSLDVYLGREFRGNVFAVNSAADPMTRSFEVQVVVPNPERMLKAGMFARVDVVVQEKQGVIAIPTDALLGTEADRHVYVVDADTAFKRSVTIGIIQNGRTEVLEGLNVGENLVVLGQQMLQHGSKVSIGGGK